MSGCDYRRFYASLHRLYGCDAEELKESLVSSYTDGRTTHLHEMEAWEYKAMCEALEEKTGWKEERRKSRSLCLRLMQKAGVDTTDWEKVIAFCASPRIAGKAFAQLDLRELGALATKPRAIMRKGGLRPRSEPVVLNLPVTGQA